MEFLKSQPRFHFLYNNKPFTEYDYTVVQTVVSDTLTTIYTFSDGLTVTNIATKKGDAYEWINWFENTSDQPTEIISDLWDCSAALPMEHEDPFYRTTFLPAVEDWTTVYAPLGASNKHTSFFTDVEVVSHHRRQGHLVPDDTKEYQASNGFSCEARAPFFNIHKNGKGYIIAIGWSGQWNCSLTRTADNLVVKTKIEDTHFRLLPGEKIRTSSIVIMPYEGTVIQSHNKWRRLLKKHYSLIGQEGRDQYGPLCTGIWGGLPTDTILKRLEIIKENKLPLEYIWMDAGWYGHGSKPTPDEFEGDWGRWAGDWTASPHTHPGGLKDVSQAIHEAGMKFVLWFEPERAVMETPITIEHPEYFLSAEDPAYRNLLLDLGNPEAWEYIFKTLCKHIEEIGVDYYRQDCNFGSILSYWRKNDTEDRKGITEIKHITGLYRLWDAMLEKFPHLMIDNCAGGGRRLDIETLRRSVPLWRSDYQCPANYLIQGIQCQHLSFNLWMPYSGSGSQRDYDAYRIRSAYGTSMSSNYAYSDKEVFDNDPQRIQWLQTYLSEYLRVRPYFSEDFYPLTEVSDRTDAWSAAQFDRPEENDGIIQIFRRENSPFDTAYLTLHAIDPQCDYCFTDADDESTFVVSGADLCKKGFRAYMPEKRSAKIYFYKKVM